MPGYYRQSIVDRARQIWEAQPVFLDTETTGLHDTAEIIEVSIIDHDGQVLLETLVKPRRPIPADVVWVHGITNPMVEAAPGWQQVWPQVEALLLGRHVGIYNAEFDLRMMRQSHLANGMPWRPPASSFFCIMKMYADFYGSMKWQKLESAGRQCRIPLPNSHRAKDDSLLARAVFQYIKDGGR
jgi:DNA polymerase III epsilon subunit-like protein